MATRSVASSALVEAYLHPSLPPGQHVFTSQLPGQNLAFSSRLTADSFRAKEPIESCAPLNQMLTGTWVPPHRSARTPRQNETFLAQREQESKRLIAEAARELDLRPQMEAQRNGSASCEPHSSRSEGRACSSSSRPSSYTASQPGGSVVGESQCDEKSVSHATTPSWRSRSFPPRFGRVKFAHNGRVNGRPRLPPLPIEARWFAATELRGAPASEVQRLHDIASDVNQANAMLVESFLNVKRNPPENMPALSVIESGVGSNEGSQAC